MGVVHLRGRRAHHRPLSPQRARRPVHAGGAGPPAPARASRGLRRAGRAVAGTLGRAPLLRLRSHPRPCAHRPGRRRPSRLDRCAGFRPAPAARGRSIRRRDDGRARRRPGRRPRRVGRRLAAPVRLAPRRGRAAGRPPARHGHGPPARGGVGRLRGFACIHAGVGARRSRDRARPRLGWPIVGDHRLGDRVRRGSGYRLRGFPHRPRARAHRADPGGLRPCRLRARFPGPPLRVDRGRARRAPRPRGGAPEIVGEGVRGLGERLRRLR